LAIRIYILAKELGVPSKILVEECLKRGLEVKTHMSSIDDQAAQALRAQFAPPTPAKPAKAPRKKAAPEARPAAPPEAPAAPASAKAVEAKPKPKRPPRKPARPAAPAPEAEKPAAPAAPAATPAPAAPPAVAPVAPPEPPKPKLARPVRPTAPPPPPKPIRSLPEVTEYWRPGMRQERVRRPRPRKGRRTDRPRGFATAAPVTAPALGKVEIAPPISVREFSQKTGVRVSKIIQDLLTKGTVVTINDMLAGPACEMLALGNGIEIEIKAQVDLEAKQLEEEVQDRPEDLQPRAPVVTFLGHVDHGKTSLLDRIRKTHVAAGEEGGITQHIGAYKVRTNSHELVFLDTPGHEAFTAMRARGAQVTDLVVLVVAADDGVMPQTVEAINHARAAKVPIVVALNKIDLPDANPQRTMQQLATEGLQPEKWGGQTIMVEVSALTGKGVDELLEMLALEAELLELKANPNKPARGTVLEAHLSPGEGVVATVLISEGTLRPGDPALAGTCFGRVRSIRDDQGRFLDQAGPSTPAEISGLDEMPEAGDKFLVVTDPQRARELADQRKEEGRRKSLAPRQHVTLETLFGQVQKTREARLVIKADVKGSMEVIIEKLNQMSTSEVKVNVLHSAIGGITESDVLLADASDAIVIGFHVVASDKAAALAEQCGVQIKTYQIIYHLLSEVHTALEQLLEPEHREVITGHAKVLQLFRSSKLGVIAGCRVTDGVISRNSQMRVARDGIVIHDGRVASLRHVKDDVREVTRDMECGIRLLSFEDLKQDDVIEAYRIEDIARKL
jgi:translation initiation factor IF-2